MSSNKNPVNRETITITPQYHSSSSKNIFFKNPKIILNLSWKKKICFCWGLRMKWIHQLPLAKYKWIEKQSNKNINPNSATKVLWFTVISYFNRILFVFLFAINSNKFAETKPFIFFFLPFQFAIIWLCDRKKRKRERARERRFYFWYINIFILYLLMKAVQFFFFFSESKAVGV